MNYFDALKRTVATAVQSAVGVVIAAGPVGLWSASVWEQAGTVAIIAALTGVHRFTEAFLGNKES